MADLYMQKHLAVQRPGGSYDFFAKEAEKYRQALAESEQRLAKFGKEQGVDFEILIGRFARFFGQNGD